jgi:ABC-type nitrate/sulfonate/bicarbonate transport system permease component
VGANHDDGLAVMTAPAVPDTRTILASSSAIVGDGIDATTGSGRVMATLVLRAGRSAVSIVVAIAVLLAVWLGFIKFFAVNPLVAKSPIDVFRYLVTSPDAGSNWAHINTGLGRTLVDAGVGFAAGLLAAFIVAVLFVLSQTIEAAFLPIAMIVRSVPLVAMTPVITLVFGRGLLGTTVVSGIVVFFPSLVIMVFGLRSAPRQAADLCRAYGASPWMTMRKVALPSALPSIFASARIAVPGALIGALLAEWLATGKGLGAQMLSDGATFLYDDLWASVVVITVASVLIYAAVGVLETVVLARFGPAPTRR